MFKKIIDQLHIWWAAYLWGTKELVPRDSPEKKYTTVTLTISSPLNKAAFEFTVTNPAGDPKETFAEFEKWFQSAGTEQYLFVSDSFRSVVMRRHISGYLVTVRNV